MICYDVMTRNTKIIINNLPKMEAAAVTIGYTQGTMFKCQSLSANLGPRRMHY